MNSVAQICSLLVVATTSVFANQAKVTWSTDATSIRAGEALRTVVKMTIDEGWHVYWTNPGANGFAPTIEAKLPEGWEIGEMAFPAPIRFMTGELPGFGYEGELLIPVTMTPPAKAVGPLPPLTATLSWLACNDQSCEPGKAEISLSTGAEAAWIAAAYQAIPRTLEHAKLSMTVSNDRVVLSLTLSVESGVDPTKFEVFPATPDIVDPAAIIKFSPSPETPNTWIATAPKSEYLPADLKEFSIVLKKGRGEIYKISTAPKK